MYQVVMVYSLNLHNIMSHISVKMEKMELANKIDRC